MASLGQQQVQQAGVPIRDANNNAIDSPLSDCFRVYKPAAIREGTRNPQRTWGGINWKQHSFKMIAVSALGAGGTGKTTTSAAIATSLAMQGHHVVLINADSQPSAEERFLDKLVALHFNDDYDSFYVSNGMLAPDEEQQQQQPQQWLQQQARQQEQYQARRDSILGALSRVRASFASHSGRRELTRPIPCTTIGVDVAKMATPRQAGAGGQGRVFLMRSDQDISNWESLLGTAFKSYANDPLIQFSVPYGALYAVAQMQAYMLGARYVVVDAAPGSGPLVMNIVMSSHAFVVPCNIDQKAASTVKALARKLAVWNNPHITHSHVAIKRAVNPAADEEEPDELNPYPLPGHTPKFLGILYSRLGIQGAKRPYNQYAAMQRANTQLRENLLPVLRDTCMLLPWDRYTEVVGRIPQFLDAVETAGDGAQYRVRVPRALGMVGVVLEFQQLQAISERECVPVPFLVNDPAVMRTANSKGLVAYAAALQRADGEPGQAASYTSFWDDKLYKPCDVKQRRQMQDKVDLTRNMIMNIVDLVKQDLRGAAAPGSDVPGVPAAVPAVGAGDEEQGDGSMEVDT